MPTSPPVADIIVAPPVVEHHSTHQRRDRQGRFSRTSNARPRWRTTTNRSRHQAAEEPAVPLVPRPEDDEYGVVEILDVMPPVFAAHDSHAQPPLLPVRIDSGFFLVWIELGFFTIYCSYGFMVFLLNQITRSSLDLYILCYCL